jgi:DNA-binding MarR family transcriptional regulator
LAQKVGVTPQSMMKTVHELEELCLISRSADPLDSRAKLVALTVKGQAFIDELTRSTLTVWDQYATVVGERDLQRTILLLKELSALNVEEQLA